MIYIFRAYNYICELLSKVVFSIKNCFRHQEKHKSSRSKVYNNETSARFNNQNIEPHEKLLTKPKSGTFLYKIVPSQYFFDMLDNNYLYFRRVDTYNDDKNDSAVLVKDNEMNKEISFIKNPEYKISSYYKSCRSKTYACCFSTSNTDHSWENYNNGDLNAICLIFDSDKLINILNEYFLNSKIPYNGIILKNFFFINHGLVNYGNFESDILANKRLPNPIIYVYFKDSKYSDEKEFRVSISCIGYEQYMLHGSKFDFPDSIQLSFDYNLAIKKGVLVRIEASGNCEKAFPNKLKEALSKKNIASCLIIKG